MLNLNKVKSDLMVFPHPGHREVERLIKEIYTRGKEDGMKKRALELKEAYKVIRRLKKKWEII